MMGIRKMLVVGGIAACFLMAASAAALPAWDRPAAPTQAAAPTETAKEATYLAAIYDGKRFYAAGTGGRMDQIGADGACAAVETATQEDILCLYSRDNLLLAGTSGGSVLVRRAEQVDEYYTGMSGGIHGLTGFRGRYFAATGEGYILTSSNTRAWQAGNRLTTEPIISIAANDAYIMAVTARGDIIQSSDGVGWKLSNFNDTYAGYYEPLVFTGIRALGTSFFVAAQYQNQPGEPFVASTEDGGIWLQKTLAVINGEETGENLDLKINAIGANLDQILAVCSGGRLLTITECSSCNTSNKVLDTDAMDLAFNGSQLLVVGKGYAYKIVDDSTYRQYKISPEQASKDLGTGVLAVDVREPDEFASGHIPGAVNIPLAQLEQELPKHQSDKNSEIIFYCKSGGRAEQALQKALELGYGLVYSLGGIDNWPYETVTGNSP